MVRTFAVIAAACFAAVSFAFTAAAQAHGGHFGGGGAFAGGRPGGGGFGGGNFGAFRGGFQGAPQAPRSFAGPGLGAGGFRGGFQAAPQTFRGFNAAPRFGGMGGRQFRAAPAAPQIRGLNAHRFGAIGAGPNRFAVQGGRHGGAIQSLRAPGQTLRSTNPQRFAREQRLGRERLGQEGVDRLTTRNGPEQAARNRGPANPGNLNRDAFHRFPGSELARRPFFNHRFAAAAAAPQAFARELQPNRTLPRIGPANNDAFRRGNGFEAHAFGGRRWRGRDGRFRRFWAGGVFWPFLFGDTVSYAFWPNDYSEPFWGYGPNSILWGSLWPDGFYGENTVAGGEARQAPVFEGYAEGLGRRRAIGEQVAGSCGGFASGIADLPLEQLERIVQPNAEQRAAFDELKAAAAKASQILASACPEQVPVTPVARLDAMEQRLSAMQQAIAVMRGPLERLYGILSDEQIQRLENAPEPGEKDQPSMTIAQLCSGESGLTDVPVDQIAQAINLTDEQKFDFDNLKQVSNRAAEDLERACPKEAPKSINARLEIAQKRVTALIQAIETIRPAMAAFYNSLTDQQKSALNAQSQEKRSARR